MSKLKHKKLIRKHANQYIKTYIDCATITDDFSSRQFHKEMRKLAYQEYKYIRRTENVCLWIIRS